MLATQKGINTKFKFKYDQIRHHGEFFFWFSIWQIRVCHFPKIPQEERQMCKEKVWCHLHKVGTDKQKLMLPVDVERA